MSSPNLRPADLADDAIARINSLEERLGGTVVAYAAESPYAALTEAQLADLQQAEQELGVRLVAYSG
jgi:hypothetical protein